MTGPANGVASARRLAGGVLTVIVRTVVAVSALVIVDTMTLLSVLVLVSTSRIETNTPRTLVDVAYEVARTDTVMLEPKSA